MRFKKFKLISAILIASLLSSVIPNVPQTVIATENVEENVNLAYQKTVTVSSEESSEHVAAYAVDADYATRWSSEYADEQWLVVDLGTQQTISSFKISWEAAYASQYQIQVSNDNSTWSTVYENNNSLGGLQSINITDTTARYVKINCIKRATQYGFSIYEFEIYSESLSEDTSAGALEAAEAKQRVLDYFYEIKGNHTVIGMHNREPNSEPAKQTNAVYEITGQYPALWSGDFLFSSSDVDNRWNMIYECERQWKAGSIVQIMLHVTPPTQSEKGNWDGGVCSKLSDSEWSSLITDGGELNQKWKARLDGYAVYLQYLEDKGVPVLFRPFHEMNQSVFWWAGRTGTDGTGALFRLTRDYLEDIKGLDNIIWVWDMQDLSYDWSAYNPGNEYWDIFAVDVYNPDNFTAYKYNTAMSVAGDKLIAIGECQKLPTAEELKAQPNWCFVMSWAELTFEYNSNTEIQNLYNAENVIVRSELPTLKEKVAPEVSADQVVWTWDFADGVEGWNFKGFTPETEVYTETGNTNLVARSQTGYDAVFSYTVTGIPNGTYALGNDINVQSNMTGAYMALSDGTTEVRSANIDTADVMLEDKVMEDTFEVTNNQVTIKYYAEAPADTNGVTFAVGDIKLYLLEGTDIIINGDFSDTTGVYPAYPIDWELTHDSSQYDAAKTEKSYLDPEGDKSVMIVAAGTTFSLSQEVEISDVRAGKYKFSMFIESNPNTTVSNFMMRIVDKGGNTVANTELQNGTCELENITLSKGNYEVVISGTLDSGTVYLDDVKLVMTGWSKPESNPDDSQNPVNPDDPGDSNIPDGSEDSDTSGDEFRIVGYLPNWYGDIIDEVQIEKFTHINYAFAIPDENGNIRELWDTDFINKLITTAHENNVKVLVSVGGWSYNGELLESTFVSATDTDEKCRAFAENVVNLVEQYGFDGADIDWEYPRSNTSAQYEAFMGYLKEGLDEKDKLLTIAVLGKGSTADACPDTVLEMLDWVNIMAYDGDAGAGHSPYSYAVECGNYWTNTRGLPAEKVVLGVPFYERPNWASYADIVKADSENAYKDSTTMNGTVVYYNGLDTIQRKTEWACENVGGIMIWEISQDSKTPELSLLNRICETIEKENALPSVNAEQEVWGWDFADGVENWNFEGFEPTTEVNSASGNTNLLAHSTDGYDAVFSYTVKDIPNGTYLLQNDIKVKSNVTEAYMALSDGTTEIRTSHIDTKDQWVEDRMMEETFQVTNNEVTIKYYVKAPADSAGATFAVGDIRLYLLEGNNVIKNGDFSETTGVYPAYPIDWELVHDSSEYDAVKTEKSWLDPEGDKSVMVVAAGTSFELSQELDISAETEGKYKFSIYIESNDNTTVSDFKMKIVDAEGNSIAETGLQNGTCELENISFYEGIYKLVISGKLESGTVYLDDVSIAMTGWLKPGSIPEGLAAKLVNGRDYVYTGSKITPEIKVYHDGKELESKDYTVSYSNNTNVYTGDDEAKMPTIKVKGKGNYADTKVINFNIIPKSLADDDVEIITEEYAEAGGKGYTPKVTVKYNGKKLKQGTDYEVVAYAKNDVTWENPKTKDIPDGEYDLYVKAIEIDGKDSNFVGQRVLPLTVIAPDSEVQPVLFSKVKVSVPKKKLYTGSAITLADDEIKVTYKGQPLGKDEYKVEYDEDTNTEIGTAKVIVTGLGKYKGSKVATFKIEGKAISKATAKVAAQTYYGGTFEDKLGVVSYTVAKGEEAYFADYERADGKTGAIAKGAIVKLKEGQDYEVNTESVNAGKGVITLTGMNFFSGTKKVTFSIKKYDINKNQGVLDGENLKVFANDDSAISIVYAKGGSKPSVTVTFGGVEMVEGIDYTLSYSNNKKVTESKTAKNKMPKITVIGKGNFTGKATPIPFTIVPQEIDAEGIVVTANDIVYKDKKNNFVVKGLKVVDDGKALKSGTDFEKVVNSDNTLTTSYQKKVGEVWESIKKDSILKAGTEVRVVIKGKGAYVGQDPENVSTTYAYYRIIKTEQNISNLTVKIDDQTYTGYEIEPGKEYYHFFAKGNPDELEDVTFDIVEGSYKSNIKKGTAKVTIKGTGSYGGTKTVSFKIKPESVTNIKKIIDILSNLFRF